MRSSLFLPFCLLLGLLSCTDAAEVVTPIIANERTDLTIFFVNDQHGRINNFAKVKSIVNDAKASGNALLVSGGDIFAGNPIVDQFSEPGFPMIDIMNQVGFDVGVLGNHEFDFGTQVLEDRINQADFPWILANVDASGSVVRQPDPFVTLTVGDLRVTFLGMVETTGKENDTIPSTHPLRVADLKFEPYSDIVSDYQNLKEQEDADLFVALSHLGAYSDRDLATNSPFFDLIIGGHSHEVINEVVNGVPLVQAGANLELLGRVDIVLEDQEVVDLSVSMIDLAEVSREDASLAMAIDAYNSTPDFSAVVGNAAVPLERFDAGCFFTTALREYMNVDFTIQNFGGVRAGIGEGPITRFEIYTMDPFNNQSVAFTKTVGEFEDFLCSTGAPFFFSGVNVSNNGLEVQFLDAAGNPLPNDLELTMGVNDYIPAVYDDFFDFAEADVREYTTAEAILGYLANNNEAINFAGCAAALRCN